MRKYTFLFIAIIIFIGLYPQSLTFYSDYSKFMYTPDTTLMEIYFETPFDQITYHNVDGKLTGYIHYYIDIEPFNGRKIHYEWISTAHIPSFEYARKKDLTIIDMATFFLPPDSYAVKLSVKDSFSNNMGSKEFMTIVEKWDTNRIVLSDLELAIRLEKSDTPSKFNKNSVFILPNARGIFGTTRFLLSTYIEGYNLKLNEPYYITYTITDTTGKDIMKLPSVEDTARDSDIVDINKFNILGIKEGKYLLKVTLSQDTMDYTVYKPFEKKNVQINIKVFDKYTKEKRKYWDRIDYIATDKEKEIFKKLKTEKGKEAFLRHFWDLRDPTPNDTINEALVEFQKKVEYANEHFSEMNKEGYYTDRGRIYIKYGEPDEIKHLESDDLYPEQELWVYYGGGGNKYYFANIEGRGFILIFSTNEEEQGIPTWEKYLNPEIEK